MHLFLTLDLVVAPDHVGIARGSTLFFTASSNAWTLSRWWWCGSAAPLTLRAMALGRVIRGLRWWGSSSLMALALSAIVPSSWLMSDVVVRYTLATIFAVWDLFVIMVLFWMSSDDIPRVQQTWDIA